MENEKGAFSPFFVKYLPIPKGFSITLFIIWTYNRHKFNGQTGLPYFAAVSSTGVLEGKRWKKLNKMQS